MFALIAMEWQATVERFAGWGAVCFVLWWMMKCSDARHADYNTHLTTLISGMSAKLAEEIEAHKVIIATQNAMVVTQGKIVATLEKLVDKIDGIMRRR